MKRKLVSIAMTVITAAAMLTGCGSSAATTATTGASDATASASAGEQASGGAIAASDIKIGMIYVGDENEGYTAAHMKGVDEMEAALGITDDQVIEKTNIPEDETAYDAAVDLADQGCNVIFATSFGHESYILQAAQEYPDIQFCHATGYQAASSGLANMHNYFDSIYEARYVSGVVAGMKLNQMIEDGKITADTAKMGYVGAFPYAEVISGFTSFYLGAKSECPTVTMDVQYTNSWASLDSEAEVANQLIADGCVLISQHADTTGAPSSCQAKGVPCVGYNVDMTTVAPDCALTSAANNWGSYYTYAVKSVLDGTQMPADYCKGYSDDAVYITDLNTKVVADGTDEKVASTIDAIKAGTLHVFDTSTFTVNGSSLEDLISSDADNYGKYSQYVSDGYFHESEVVSAPAFDLIIDGITSESN